MIKRVASKLTQQIFRNVPKQQFISVSQLMKFQNVQKQNNFVSLNNQFIKTFSVKVVNVPNMGDSITEGTVQEFQKKVGDYVKVDDIIALIETDKVTVDLRSADAGVITKLYANQGDTIEVGKAFYEIDTSATGGATSEAPKQAKEQPKQAEAPKEAVKEAPKQAPVEQKKEAPKEAPKQAAQTTTASTSTTQLFSRGERREKMSRMRLKIAERLKQSQNTYALLTTFQEVDMSAAMEARKELQEDFSKKHGVKLGFMSFFIKASAQVLKEIPALNAVIDGQEVIYRDYVDVSVAVATPTGLLVPVIRNCESLSFADIEKKLIELSQKGKNGKITVEDMAGGTFTISNGGVFGSLMGTPILNPPQSAILGMHAIINRPVVRGGEIVARPMMYLALTYDHRLIDGKEAATGLKKIATLIEDPRKMLLDI